MDPQGGPLLVVLAGLVTPVIIEVVEGVKGLKPAMVAPALVLMGGLALRWFLVAAGQV